MAHSIGKTIDELRKAKGWTQIELAEKLNVSDKAVSKWEKDNGLPSIEFFPALADLFGVSIDYLMTGKKTDKKKELEIKENKTRKVDNSRELLNYDTRVNAMLVHGIIDIEQLLETKDVAFVKKALNEYPITIIDWAYNLIKANDWKQLFRFAVDNNFGSLANIIATTQKEEEILKFIWSTIYKSSYSQPSMREDIKYRLYSLNMDYLRLYKDKGKIFFPDCIPHLDFYSSLQYFKQCKEQVVLGLEYQLDKDTTLGDLTKEYFEDELSKGNIDMVVIKLCVRLEAILKCDYHYDGELSTMLEKYCQEHGWEDDGWGYSVESSFVKYLHKLRMKRNNIVHCEKNSVDLSLEELQYCIDYICKMG